MNSDNDSDEDKKDEEETDAMVRATSQSDFHKYLERKANKYAISMSGETGLEPVMPAKSHYDLHQQANRKRDTRAHSPVLFVVIAAILVAIFLAVLVASQKQRGNYSSLSKSGLSTSSSDITSSETGSTDRELKSRMERFEKRLEEHKKMLETRDPEAGSTSVTDSESKLTSSVGGSGTWFNKK